MFNLHDSKTDTYGLTWRVTKVRGLDHGPCNLLGGKNHGLDPRIATVLPQGALSDEVKAAIRKYVVDGKLKYTQLVGLLTKEFPDLISSERQIRNCMNQYKTSVGDFCCRALLEVLLTEQAADPDFSVAYKLDEDNVLTGVLWVTPQQKREWLSTPDIMMHDNTYNLDDQGYKLGNFNGIDCEGRTIDLGCAFILDETACDYEWQFSTWQKFMHGVEPTIVGTDSDPAATIAAEAIFPNAFYFWCIW